MTDEPTEDSKPFKYGPQPHGGFLAAPKSENGRPENFVKGRAERTALREKVGANPDAALEEIHKDLTSLTRKVLRRAEREGKVPPRATMDVIREFRQTQEAVNEARKSRGALAEAQELLVALDDRIFAAIGSLGGAEMERVRPHPAVEVPVAAEAS